jgi:hypothetical protein
MSDDKPAFTEDDVANDFFDAVDYAIVCEVGRAGQLRLYQWLDDDPDEVEGPYIVLYDGREFEVDIDVRVTELTPERKAARAAEEQRVLAMLERYAQATATGATEVTDA